MPTVFITGANRGLGFEFARQYAADGWRVLATCRDPAQATALMALRDGSVGPVEVNAMDVTDHAQIDALAGQLAGQPIDVLINNAGIASADFPRQMFGGLDYAGWLSMLSTNTLGPVKVAEALLENVAASQQRKIIAISSTVGSMVEMDHPVFPYATSKAALNKAIRLMASQLQAQGIILAALCPGHAKTDMGLMAEGASVEVDDSVAGMRSVIASLTPARSGSFTRYNGETVAW
jgi:NAD(P)-dependent dehydrogenase (short-subunit alcohol dehydrogenase family)